ncbi:MAG: tetratricopeptide repeat protein [Methylococcaceae bacterium]|nr:tetratricopeptide repeat protein [Methylococcaceae bacterium]
MSLLNQMLRDLEHNKTTTTPALAKEKAVHVSPSAQTKNLKKAVLTAVVISSIALFFVYLAIKPEPAAVNKPLAIPPLKTASKQRISQPQPITTTNSAPIAVKAVSPKVIATSVKSEPIPVTQPLKSKQHRPPNINAPAIIKAQQAENSIQPAPLNTDQQAKNLYQKASKTDNSQLAISLLKQSLNLAPKQIKTRLLLTHLLINAGDKQNAIDLLDESLAIFPQETAFLMARAQLYLQEKKTENALQLLTQIATSAQNEAYLALLAAAYHQNKSYAQARDHYQSLVHFNANKAEYWLGLALAQDALNNKEPAYNAYQQALNLHSLNPPVSDYIQQRLKQRP